MKVIFRSTSSTRKQARKIDLEEQSTSERTTTFCNPISHGRLLSKMDTLSVSWDREEIDNICVLGLFTNTTWPDRRILLEHKFRRGRTWQQYENKYSHLALRWDPTWIAWQRKGIWDQEVKDILESFCVFYNLWSREVQLRNFRGWLGGR